MANFNLLGCYDYGKDVLGLKNVTTSKGQEFFRDLTAGQASTWFNRERSLFRTVVDKTN